ncbi:hypothetical protein D6821_01350 [Candidatus Parcubacteria bacterium]|nr:MAG: hypothetical protein D6821_01350 [Candidatus Parcubacteria bacterium]
MPKKENYRLFIPPSFDEEKQDNKKDKQKIKKFIYPELTETEPPVEQPKPQQTKEDDPKARPATQRQCPYTKSPAEKRGKQIDIKI